MWASRTESQYRTPGVSFINGKICRFNLNGAFNDVILSKNARLILELAYFPAVANMSAYVNLIIVTSSEDSVFDTLKNTSGNPILVTFISTNQTVLNNSELFYNFNVPSTFLSKGYMDVEVESPIITASVAFSASALARLVLSFAIVDEDDEEINNPNISQTIDYKNYGRLGMPI
jgi:hypothetical protein